MSRSADHTFTLSEYRFKVKCPNNVPDSEVDKLLDQMEGVFDLAEEALKNRLKEIDKRLTLEKIG